MSQSSPQNFKKQKDSENVHLGITLVTNCCSCHYNQGYGVTVQFLFSILCPFWLKTLSGIFSKVTTWMSQDDTGKWPSSLFSLRCGGPSKGWFPELQRELGSLCILGWVRGSLGPDSSSSKEVLRIRTSEKPWVSWSRWNNPGCIVCWLSLGFQSLRTVALVHERWNKKFYSIKTMN